MLLLRSAKKLRSIKGKMERPTPLKTEHGTIVAADDKDDVSTA